jgi:hypothetical protein
LVTKNVLEHKSTRSKVKSNVLYQVADPVIARADEGLSQAKKADIRSMLKFMPACDREFMSLLV